MARRRGGVDLTTIGRIAVAVGAARLARSHDTAASAAAARAARHRAATTAGPAVAGVAADVGLAAVRGVAVTVLKAAGAHEHAGAVCAQGCGHRARGARIAAPTAVSGGATQIGFASVARVAIAVAEARSADSAACTGDTRGRAVGKRRAGAATGAAMAHVGLGVDATSCAERQGGPAAHRASPFGAHLPCRAGPPARAAVGCACARVGLAAVVRVAVAISPSCGAHANRARARRTRGRGIG